MSTTNETPQTGLKTQGDAYELGRADERLASAEKIAMLERSIVLQREEIERIAGTTTLYEAGAYAAEQAEEITRLTADVQALHSNRDVWIIGDEANRAEIKKLNEAIDRLKDMVSAKHEKATFWELEASDLTLSIEQLTTLAERRAETGAALEQKYAAVQEVLQSADLNQMISDVDVGFSMPCAAALGVFLRRLRVLADDTNDPSPGTQGPSRDDSTWTP